MCVSERDRSSFAIVSATLFETFQGRITCNLAAINGVGCSNVELGIFHRAVAREEPRGELSYKTVLTWLHEYVLNTGVPPFIEANT